MNAPQPPADNVQLRTHKLIHYLQQEQTTFIMTDYENSSYGAASGKNNQSSFAIHYVKTTRIRKATEDRPTNQPTVFLLKKPASII